jgi:hypothetical protein
MTEDEISQEMYLAALAEPDVEVLSWQGVGGKSYLTRDVRIRTAAGVMAPDLILLVAKMTVWLIEIKGSHAESLADDEPKLRRLSTSLSDREIMDQVARRARVELSARCSMRLAVAYDRGHRISGCDPDVEHIPWEETQDLGAVLKAS